MTKPVVRTATVADVPVIRRFIAALADYERLADQCVATEVGVRESLFGAEPAAEVLIAEVGGAPAGFALFHHNYSTFLAQRGIWLEDLFVDPAFRAHGVGRRLLGRLAAIAQERGCARVKWSVLDWNELAIGFYNSVGAEAQPGWTDFCLSGDALAALASSDLSPAYGAPASHSSIPQMGGRERRIMVVDDSRDAADSLGTILELMGATVRVVYDGASALNALDTFRPHAALLDIGMPGMDGYELARQMRQRPDHDGLRLVALTGWGQDEARKLSREVGFDDHWVKPVDPQTLMTLFTPEAR
ncbi:MAG: GNAT family N-acetyltransferase [Gemmatimonadales bacterium]|nr:GNAT family N-acetyltransferase [Gemmatimonadales bacterium]